MKLKKRKCYLQLQQYVLSATTKTNELVVQANFTISQITAKK
jgi:hypothetical protein